MKLSHARTKSHQCPRRFTLVWPVLPDKQKGQMGNSTVGHTQRTETETLLTLPPQLPNLFLVLVILNLRQAFPPNRTESVLLKLNLAKP
ncbi:hypothetical protein L3X38_028552 [Prunus dulcis]|uniref:Uncharacterized protein n=2 Tax=Prunus dulcis TaxID=3755 RepID=A0AAD4Z1D4_PRUDU|nr:hypothetical protein L3X38_028552 [Prunus dulcis]